MRASLPMRAARQCRLLCDSGNFLHSHELELTETHQKLLHSAWGKRELQVLHQRPKEGDSPLMRLSRTYGPVPEALGLRFIVVVAALWNRDPGSPKVHRRNLIFLQENLPSSGTIYLAKTNMPYTTSALGTCCGSISSPRDIGTSTELMVEGEDRRNLFSLRIDSPSALGRQSYFISAILGLRRVKINEMPRFVKLRNIFV